MEPTTFVHVDRHPAIPSLTLDDVFVSGSPGVSLDENNITLSVEPAECFEGATSLGKGWLFNQVAGMVFVTAPELFIAAKVDVMGFSSDAARLLVPPAALDARIESLREQSVCMPYVDITGLGHAGQKGWFSKASHLFVECEDQHGNRREYALKSGKDWYAPSDIARIFDGRWDNESEALVVQIVDEVIGGERFWEATRQKLRDLNLRFGPVEPPRVNCESIFGSPDTLPRLLDGPEETLDAVNDMLEATLQQAGFTETEAIAKTYCRRNGASAWLGSPGFATDRAGSKALTDTKLAAMLLERWQPSHDSFKAAKVQLPDSQLHLQGMEWLEGIASGAPSN